ncbi:CsoS2 family carboxysome shell protein [Synechococcus sp. Tobar12-5m-g]|uniref:carboxysome assembly protein CsoS2 n=1 Tax=unclassified Synechococcus TaxID=2626047 RepID=UPI0020CD5804|nr:MULTISPECIES: CsoS2 family carboxysome shell protein [unclassified Synechococcus]MCP9771764.1 CsoS2 family carboxysome shell protein [Synechococcus sp. Tobar12-5m-g]MCP9872706.1 CsoS2 family carboxysome shell protein [Synechococcus sp. Cruz CV-v-12]
MATQSSREAALARRLALSTAGKTAEKRFASSPDRVRSASEARPTRAAATVVASALPVPMLSQPGPASRHQASSQPRNRAPISNPSRDLVLARREALSKRGKRADTSKDRTRTAPAPASPAATAFEPAVAASAKASTTEPTRASRPLFSEGSAQRQATKSNPNHRNGPKRSAQHNPSRAVVLARREAQSKHGKSAAINGSTGTAAVVRQTNPDMSSRDLAHRIRDLKSKNGAAAVGGCTGVTRPTGPRRGPSKVAGAQDATWKVGVGETSRGQLVTGTQATRSLKTTGNEASTCRPITGTEYMGADIFRSFCQSEPQPLQPAKVAVTATSHGNKVTGNEVGRSEKVTGDEPGTCKIVTGTEYLSANQSAAYCGVSSPAPRKVGLGQTLAGRPVSGVMVGRSEKVTGDEHGAGLRTTGTQYVGSDSTATPGKAPAKVGQVHTLRGTGITGTLVGRSDKVTGNEPGTCRRVTGDEYIGSQQYDNFCGARPEAEAAKVSFSLTNKQLVVSGTSTGRSSKVTGDEPGTCKAVTGTPYAGLEQAGEWCAPSAVNTIRQRTPMGRGTPGPRLSGIQPGIGGVMTGASKGACEPLTGTPYVGVDQYNEACAVAQSPAADFPQPLEPQPWQQFSVQSPARAAQQQPERSGAVTGTRYETSARITGPFDLAGDKVTGTEQFRFDRRAPHYAGAAMNVPAKAPVSVDEDSRPVSRVTGEGISAGLHITGDDWDRGKRVTGTEGVSARRRNPTRTGPMPAMAGVQPKRNEEVTKPVSRVTGSSGNTDQGSLITVSGGARG